MSAQTTAETSLRRRAVAVLAKPFPRLLRERSPALRERSPWFFVDGRGARLRTADGRSFLDLEMGRGPLLLGYRPPALEDPGARAAPARSSLLCEVEVEVAERLVALFPCAERVVFGKNGSDSCTAAVRVARALTGRSTVLSSGFHGFHDWCAASYPWVTAGLPASYGGLVKSFALNDVAALDQLAAEAGPDLAAIIVEPAHHTLPEPAFLRACREVADWCGAVLIYDEVVTAFRLDLHGAQGLYGVVPDLACLGKAMANGEAISALVGRAEVMRGLDETYYSMTFQNDNRVLEVARRCLQILASGQPTAAVQVHGEALRQAFDGAAARRGLPHRACGFAGRQDLRFQDLAGVSAADQEEAFASALLDHQVLPVKALFACAALTSEDLDQAASAFEAGMEAAARVVERGAGRAADRR